MLEQSTLSADWQQWHDPSQLQRLKHYAEYTDPALMVDPLNGGMGPNDTVRQLVRDYQSLGAVLLNNLAAKMAGMLFPVNQPNFRIQISDQMEQQASTRKNWDPIQLQTAVATLERKACERLYLGNSYTKLQRAIKLCITTGECLVFRDSEGGNLVVWNRHSYSVKRDPLGRVWRIILKQIFDPKTLPTLLRDVPLALMKDNDKVELYTQVEFQDSPVPGAARIATITHELEGKAVPGVVETYPEHLCPMFVATWTVQDGEHYGRGLVENFGGDFARLSALSHNAALYEIDSLTALRMFSPDSISNLDAFVGASTGDYVPGVANGPALVSFDPGDYNKINAVNQSIAAISQRLSQAFMYGGIQRDSERTTATEVSLVAKEADQALGGAYSQLAQTLQAPLAYLTMAELGDDIVSGLIGEHFKPSIVTGVQALARSADTQKLLELAQLSQAAIPGLVQIDQTLDASKILSRIASNAGVSLDDFRKSPAQLQQEAQAAQQMAAAQQTTNAALINNAQKAQQGLGM